MTLSSEVWNKLKRLKNHDFGLKDEAVVESTDTDWKSLDNEETARFKEKKRRELDVLFGAKYSDLEKELAAVKEENKHLMQTIKIFKALIENAESKWWVPDNEK